MPEEQLQNVVEALRAEISRLEGIDAPSRERLNRLLGDVELKLEHPQDAAHHQYLVEQLSNDLTHFEVTHPALTKALNDLLATLSAAGI
jgi:hypothetical protein